MDLRQTNSTPSNNSWLRDFEIGVETQETLEVVEPEKKRGKKAYFGWNDELEFTFVNCVFKHKGYKRTKESMETKFKLICATLISLPGFRGSDLNHEQLHKKWTRMANDIEKKYSLEHEGANLSGHSRSGQAGDSHVEGEMGA